MMLNLERCTLLKAAIQFVGECLVLFTAAVLLTAWRDATFANLLSASTVYPDVILFVMLCQACIHTCGLYDPSLDYAPIERMMGLAQAFAIAFSILAAILLLAGKSLDPLSIFLEYGTLIGAAMTWRIAIRKVFFSDRFRPPVIFLGCENDAKKIHRFITPSDQSPGRIPLGNCFKIVTAADIRNVSCPPSTMGQGTQSKVPFTVLDSHDQVIDLARQYRTRQVLVGKAMVERLSADQFADMKLQGLHLCSEDAMLEAVSGRRDPKNVDPQKLIYSGSFQHSIRRLFKRLGDIVLSSLLLVLLSPVLGTHAFILAIKNKGKMFQTQPCVGLHKKVFARYLFDGPAREAHGSTFKTSLRQLPQLWNILKGDMSLVGPCPIGPEQDEILCHELPIFDERNTVRPGLTGWARVNGKCDGSNEAYRHMLGYDLFYLKHMSLFLDIVTMSRAMHIKRTNKKLYSFTTQRTQQTQTTQ